MHGKPLIDFMIIGAQKCGTTALGRMLGGHPDLCMSSIKENHVFDDVDFDPAWSTHEIDARYAPFFDHATPAQLKGEATPIYLYWSETVAHLHRYNRRLKLIVILRDPLERALSHHRMERHRGFEARAAWSAFLLEPLRLLREQDRRGPHSAYRFHSYLSRGFYASQLRRVLEIFPKEQLLVVHNRDLRHRPRQVLAQVCAHLGVAAERFVGEFEPAPAEVLAARGLHYRLLGAMLYGLDKRRLRKLLDDFGKVAPQAVESPPAECREQQGDDEVGRQGRPVGDDTEQQRVTQ
ncbi:MAG: sulfotransferase [Rhodocyclaceae bacterium]|nr:sulfotransferase [Rhodocyclaceae bacterium]